MESRAVTFPNAVGQRLAGRLALPAGAPAAIALFAHCFTCGKSSKVAYHLSRALTARGFAVLRFDFTGLGESGGDFADTDLSSNVSDVVAAAHFLGGELGPPRLLIGHSLGGAAVLKAAGDLPAAAAVATIGTAADPARPSPFLAWVREQVERSGEAELGIGGKRVRIRRAFFEDLGRADLKNAIGRLGRALLILHSPGDEVVPLSDGLELFEAARQPKSFVSLDGADHLLSSEADALYAGSVIATWAKRYVGRGSGP